MRQLELLAHSFSLDQSLRRERRASLVCFSGVSSSGSASSNIASTDAMAC